MTTISSYRYQLLHIIHNMTRIQNRNICNQHRKIFYLSLRLFIVTKNKTSFEESGIRVLCESYIQIVSAILSIKMNWSISASRHIRIIIIQLEHHSF